jgi:hypothetical protein
MKSSKVSAALNLVGTVCVTLSYATGPEPVRIITKGRTLVICTQQDRFVGLGGDDLMKFGSGNDGGDEDGHEQDVLAIRRLY